MNLEELIIIVQAQKHEPMKVIEACLTAFGITLSQFRSSTRERHICEARHACMYLFRSEIRATYTEIGVYMRPKAPYDHTTIIHGCRVAKNLIQLDDAFNLKYTHAKSLIKLQTSEVIIPDDILLREYDKYLERQKLK